MAARDVDFVDGDVVAAHRHPDIIQNLRPAFGPNEQLVAMPHFADIDIVFDATSAGAHAHHNEVLQSHGKRVVDLTPAAIGPFTIPPVNGEAHLDSPNVNMVTCGGQATIPIVHAVDRVAKVRYAEIVASIASRSAGPGTRANIDEFTETTSQAIVDVGGAEEVQAVFQIRRLLILLPDLFLILHLRQ